MSTTPVDALDDIRRVTAHLRELRKDFPEIAASLDVERQRRARLEAYGLENILPLPTVDFGKYRDGVPPIQWLREPWIARDDVGIAGGIPFIGKSSFAVQLAVSIASGAPFADSPGFDAAPCLFVDGEAGERSIVRLAKRFGGPIPGLEFTSAAGALSLLDSDCVRRLHRSLFDLRPVLLILDSVSTTFGLKNENDSTDVRRAFEELFIIREKFGCAVLALHHEAKGPTDGRNARPGLERLRGSSAFGALASLVLHLTAAPGNKALDVAVVKARDREMRGYARRFEEFKNGDLVALRTTETPEAAETALDATSRALVEHMADGSDYRRRELITAIGVHEKVVSKALTHLHAVGRIESPKRGIWRLTAGPSLGNERGSGNVG